MEFKQEEPWDEENAYLKFSTGGKSIILKELFDDSHFDYSDKEMMVHSPRGAIEAAAKPSPKRLSTKSADPALAITGQLFEKIQETLGDDPELLEKLKAKLGTTLDISALPPALGPDTAVPDAVPPGDTAASSCGLQLPKSWEAPPTGASQQARVIDDLEKLG